MCRPWSGGWRPCASGRPTCAAAELKKAKVVLSLAQEAEWLPLLQQRQQALRLLTQQLATQDRALNQLVYALYGLTKPEIALAEGPA